MRKLFGWTAGLVGIAALARILATRHAGVVRPAPTTIAPAADPAEALRRKLSETREEPGAAAGTPPTGSPEPTETLEERRARVHAKAQEAMDEMDAALQEPPA